ncbi:MAG: hypothetical protein GYA02_17610 [Clostridiaceae bacterium]|jgi:hypothetical protein|nr:hypothetical protein [Clostridiaceae bacterium]
MRFYAARETITPEFPVKMAGYESRTGYNKGIHDELFSKCVIFDDGNKKVMLIALDLCMLDNIFVYEIKDIIFKQYNFNHEDIIIHTTHTHAGPRTYLFGERTLFGTNSETDKYMEYLKQQILKSIEKCLENSFEGEMEIGTGETYIGSSRRQKTQNGYSIGPNMTDDIDRNLTVLKIKDDKNTVRLILFSCPCHPVVLYPDNESISADYPGAACRELEKRYPDSMAVFLQGTGADINPAVLIGGDKYRSTFYTDVLITGKILANDVNNILKCGMRKLVSELKTSLSKINLPLGELKTDYFMELMQSGNADKAKYGKRMLEIAQSDMYSSGCLFQISIVELAKDVRIIGLEGEICNKIGIDIRNLFTQGNTIVLGYTNGSVSYIPTQKILSEGGYEAVCAYTKSGIPAPFADNTESVILEHISTARQGTADCAKTQLDEYTSSIIH